MPSDRGTARRAVLGGGVGAALAGSAAALTAVVGPARATSPSVAPRSGGEGPRVVPFAGVRQAGVTTPPPAHTRWVALDLADHTPELSTDPAWLTVTVGLGGSAFRRLGRTDLAPSWLRDLPDFATDELEPRWSGGDVVLQIGSTAPTTTSCGAGRRAGPGSTRRPSSCDASR